MGTQEIQIVRLFNEAINRHDVEALCSFMTPDHTFIDAGGGITTGVETMKKGWKDFFQMFPDYRNEMSGFLQDGNTIMAYGRATGTYNGKRGLVLENRITMPAAWKAVIQNGLIREWQVYADWSEGVKIVEEDERAKKPMEGTAESRHSSQRQPIRGAMIQPFRDGDTFNTFRNIIDSVTNEIKSLDNQYVLKASEIELEEYFTEKVLIDPLILHSEQRYIKNQSGTQIDVSHDFRRAIFSGEPAAVMGTKIDIAIPLEGDPMLWRVRASTFSIGGGYPDNQINSGVISFSISFPDDSADPDRLKSNIEKNIKSLQDAVGVFLTRLVIFF